MRGSQNGPSGTYCSSTLTVSMSSSRWRTRAGLAHARSPSLPWPLRYGLQSRVTQRWRRPDSCFLGDEREWDSLEFESAITLPRCPHRFRYLANHRTGGAPSLPLVHLFLSVRPMDSSALESARVGFAWILPSRYSRYPGSRRDLG